MIGALQLLAACERHRSLQHGDRARVGRDLRLARERRRSSSPRRWHGATRSRPASSATSASSRTTSTTSPGATPRSPAACCATSPRSGPTFDTPLVGYLSLPVVPTQLGFDPRLQFIHSVGRDRGPRGGGPQPGPRRRQRRAVGRGLAEPDPAHGGQALGADPAPAVRPRAGPARAGGCGWAAPTTTASGCCASGAASTTRRLREEVGYEPRFDALGAVRDFAESTGAAGSLRFPARATLADALARGDERGGARGTTTTDGHGVGPDAVAELPAPGCARGSRSGLGPLSAAQRAATGLPDSFRERARARSRSGCAASTPRTSGASTRSSPRP